MESDKMFSSSETEITSNRCIWHITNSENKNIEKHLKKESCVMKLNTNGLQEPTEIRLKFFFQKQQSDYGCWYSYKKFEYLAIMAQLLSPKESSLSFHINLKGASKSRNGNFTISHNQPTVIVPQFFFLGVNKYTINFQTLLKVDPSFIKRPTDFCLEIRAALLSSELLEVPSIPSINVLTSEERICLDIARMLKTPDNFPDVRFETKDKKYISAHRFILSARSPYFAKLFNNVKDKGGDTDVIKIDFAMEEHLKVLFHWVYTGKMPEEILDPKEQSKPMDVIQLAVQFGMEEFCQIADQTLAKFCNTENMFDLYRVAEKFNMKTAFVDIADFIKRNVGLREDNL